MNRTNTFTSIAYSDVQPHRTARLVIAAGIVVRA